MKSSPDRGAATTRRSIPAAPSILDSLRDSVVVVDRAGVITTTNRAWDTFCRENGGDPKHTALGVSYLDVCERSASRGDALAGEALAGILSVLNAEQESYTLEYPCHIPSRKLWFLLRAAPLNGGDGGVVISHTDITDRRLAEEAVREQEKQLRAANAELAQSVEERTQALEEAHRTLVDNEKLAALGRLTGGVAHELRNPLGVISNTVYYLQRGKEISPAETVDCIGDIAREVASANRVVAELLDYTRQAQPSRSVFPIDEPLRRLASSIEAPRGVTVRPPEPMPGEGPLLVEANAEQVERALANFVRNAVQAMGESGGQVCLHCYLRGHEVVAEVADTGCGISPSDLQRVFEPLYTSKSKGIGLGLAVATRYAELNGGRLEVESTEGKGSKFRLVLPATLPRPGRSDA